MAYQEEIDPLTGKAKRHSRSAAISGVLGINKSIIVEDDEEIPEVPESKPNVWKPLNIVDNEIVFNNKSFRGADVGDEIKKAWANGNELLWVNQAFSSVGIGIKKFYQVKIGMIMNGFMYKNEGRDFLTVVDTSAEAYKFVESYMKTHQEIKPPEDEYKGWTPLKVVDNKLTFGNTIYSGTGIDEIEKAWGKKKTKKYPNMLWVSKLLNQGRGGKTLYQVNLYNQHGVITLSLADTSEKAYDYADKYLRQNP